MVGYTKWGYWSYTYQKYTLPVKYQKVHDTRMPSGTRMPSDLSFSKLDA